MLPAPTFEDILRRAPSHGDPENPSGRRLISIVFANPTSAVWRDVHTDRAFLDERSGDMWDLFFAGLSVFARMDSRAKGLWDPFWHERWPRYLNPKQFSDVEGAVRAGQAAALAHAPERSPWRYSGGTDLVSFMCYGQVPDWLSLLSVRLEMDERQPARPNYSLGEITEGLRMWQDDRMDPVLAPGEFDRSRDPVYRSTLAEALVWSASAVGAGVLGNSAFELLQKIMRH